MMLKLLLFFTICILYFVFPSNLAFAANVDNSSISNQEINKYEKEYDFSLKYPSNWELNDEPEDTDDFIVAVFPTENTFLNIGNSRDSKYANLEGDDYLEQMIKDAPYEKCGKYTFEENGFICSNFQHNFAMMLSNDRYLTYVIGYDYTDETEDGAIFQRTEVSYQIPDRGDTWLIHVTSTDEELLSYHEEIIGILNSFTIYGYEEFSHDTPLITDENFESFLDYDINGGEILSIIPDVEADSIIITIATNQDGSLVIALPRNLIDSKIGEQDDEFFVLINGDEVDFEEIATDDERRLFIEFPSNAEEIEIIGTFVVPEFGSVIMIVMALGFFSIVFSKFQKIGFKVKQ